MFEAADRKKLDAIVEGVTALVATNTAILTGVTALNSGIDGLRELTAQLVDAVTSEETGDIAEEIAKMAAALLALTTLASEIGTSIHSRVDDIALENGLAVPAPA